MLYIMPGTAGYFPGQVTLVLRRTCRSCFHYRSRIFLYLTYAAGGFVWEGQQKGVRGEWSACTCFARPIAASSSYFAFPILRVFW